jgi:hypothetical protein
MDQILHIAADVALGSVRARGRTFVERMAQIVGVWNFWGPRIYAIRSALVRPWVQGFQRNPHFFQTIDTQEVSHR